MSKFIVMTDSSPQKLFSSVSKVSHDLLIAIFLQLVNLFFNGFKSFIFELRASKIRHHFSLVWQVKFVVASYLFPCLSDVDRHTVHWDIFGTVLRIETIRTCNIELSFKSFYLFIELIFLELHVRETLVFKLKEVVWS